MASDPSRRRIDKARGPGLHRAGFFQNGNHKFTFPGNATRPMVMSGAGLPSR